MKPKPPTFTCRCGTTVPVIDTWLWRKEGWEAMFCFEACAERTYPTVEHARAAWEAWLLRQLGA